MIDIERLAYQWIRYRHRLDHMEIKLVGWKSQGIEYRIMKEAGVASIEDDRRVYSEHEVIAFDLVWTRLFDTYHDEMIAVEEWAKHKSVRSVRTRLRCSQHSSKEVLRKGLLLMTGALELFMDKTSS